MNELTVIQPHIPAFSYSDIERIAGAFAQSRMFGVSDPAAALSLCLLAQAEGQHPAIAFRDYSIIQGKPAKKAEAMQRDFLASGGKIKWLQLDDTCAKAEFSHPAGGTAVVDWTMARAKAAGIGGKDMWKKYPRQMLRSRTISEGVRTVCPMATSGMYVPEEVEDFEPTSRNTPEAPPVDIETGEFIERQKVVGISAIKKRLGDLMRAGNATDSLEEFNALVHDCADDLTKIKDANHEYWTGDGADSEGFKAWIKRRREELSKTDSLGFQMLCSAVLECKSADELKALLDQHEAAIAELDGDESRRFEDHYNAHEATLANPTHLTAQAVDA
jgi:hypothetical protein